MANTEWFTQARFGMFIHWGLYSNPAGIWKGKKNRHPYSEWLQASEKIPREEYRRLTEQFNPRFFCADDWIAAAEEAGMKYFLITAKHHDGFALWPSQASSYNVMDATPFKRDILGELAAACQKRDIKFGLYYSHWQDWEGNGGDICTVNMENDEYRHPDQAGFEAYWQGKCLPQIRELMESYDPAFFWFDSWDDYEGKGRDFTGVYLTRKRQDELIDLIRNLNPECLINSRLCFDNPSDRVDYLSMMDNVFPDKGYDKPWETSGTLNESWAYHRMDYDWKPTERLIKNLIANASLGGNYQLNVGPTGDGLFQKAAIKRLREIGLWLEANGEALYGTRGSSLGTPGWGRITEKTLVSGKKRYFLHLWDYEPGGSLTVKGIKGEVSSARILETDQPVPVEVDPEGIVLTIPREAGGCSLPVIALETGKGYGGCPQKRADPAPPGPEAFRRSP